MPRADKARAVAARFTATQMSRAFCVSCYARRRSMKPVAILEDPAVTPLPTYTAADVRRALEKDGRRWINITLDDLASLDRADADVLVLPYRDGEMGGAPLEGLIRFHEQGGGLLFLGDTPHAGRSYPYCNSQGTELRLTRARDPLTIRGLTPLGRELLGELLEFDKMLGREVVGVRVSAFAPDECHNLLVCDAGFKKLSPVVFIERRHPRFLGAKAAVVGFDGGEPRENIAGVCDLPWTFEPGLLTREWAGADAMVARLARAVRPDTVGVAIELDPLVAAGEERAVSALVRDMGGGEIARVAIPSGPAPAGAQVFSHEVEAGGRIVRAGRTRFGCLPGEPPPLSLGFSVYRVFPDNRVDDAYRDFIRTTGKLGMQYVRMNLDWGALEPEPGKYCWDTPDQLLEVAAREGLPAMFWMFPTARGSGLSDAGVPAWTLREPSIDRDGKPGNFPCIWSPFYRERYFALLDALTKRYAGDPRLFRFAFDFGNSDFAYSYHFYGDRADLFDYSPHEQAAFARWLEHKALPLDEISRRWGRGFKNYAEVPVPLSEQTEAWMIYEDFRVWGIHEGIKQAMEVIRRNAPAKLPPDLPGHGLGSIADISTYLYNAMGRHWDQLEKREHALVEAHNSGRVWGGEAWQVGGTYADYDDAVFHSIRLEAHYNSIPGPVLGVYENDIGRIAMLRRSLAGSRRLPPRVAIMDRMAWNDWASLAQVGARLDQPVDIVSRTCRYDYSEYALLALPPDEVVQSARGASSLLPLDEGYYLELLAAVQKGLRVLVFPRTGLGDPLNPMRRLWGLQDVGYGPRERRAVAFPDSWGGGAAEGAACAVAAAPGDGVWLRDVQGAPLAVFRPRGKGGFILAGYDSDPDSPDGDFRYDSAASLDEHTLARLLKHLGVRPERLRTGEACLYKEYMFRGDRDVLLLYSHHAEPRALDIAFRPRKTPHRVFDLAFGEDLEFAPDAEPGWFRISPTILPRRGCYLVIE